MTDSDDFEGIVIGGVWDYGDSCLARDSVKSARENFCFEVSCHGARVKELNRGITKF
jgi:hypothetical protein